MAIAEVTVLGGGIFGLSVAYACVLRGARVRLIEKHKVGAGSSGGVVGALAPHTPDNWNLKKQFQFESLLLAETWWTRVAAETGMDPGYARLGRLQPIQDQRSLALARERSQSALTYWLGQARFDVVTADEFGDWAPHSECGLYIFDSLSARLHPRKACVALAAAIRNLGGEIIEGDTEARPQGRVVEATGLDGLVELSAHFERQVGNGVKGQGAVLRFDGRHLPQLFADGLHIVPHTDGTVGVGSTSERDYIDPASTDRQLDEVLARARTVCPALRDAPELERWAGVRPRARSRAPMLGHHPLRPDRLIANGGFKIGFGMAPKVGEVMADLILDDLDTIPDEFRVESSLR